MGRLTDKVAVITGGAGGIGRAAAALFSREGARVLLVDYDAAALQSAAADLDDARVGTCVADVSDPAQVEAYVRTAVERYGGLDILLNNAGIGGVRSAIVDHDVADFDRVMAVNVRGVWLGIKYAVPAMAERGGGSIVITSSVAGLRGSAGLSAYVTSKHAVIGMMRSAALECARLNIRVNTVNLAPIDTQMMHLLEEWTLPDAPEQARRLFEERSPFRRYGSPDEVANLMLFLAGDESRFCSGGVYTVDGAWTA